MEIPLIYPEVRDDADTSDSAQHITIIIIIIINIIYVCVCKDDRELVSSFMSLNCMHRRNVKSNAQCDHV